MTWATRKKERSDYYKKYVHKWKLRPCTACAGSGRYDHNGSPPCASCNGTGKERYKVEQHAPITQSGRVLPLQGRGPWFEPK